MNRVMETFRTVVTTAVLSAVLGLNSGTAHAQTCQPGIAAAFAAHPSAYNTLLGKLGPHVLPLLNGLAALVDQATYETLLTEANTIADDFTIQNGRVLMTLPDGTVILDTSREDDPGDLLPEGNSFAHFGSKTVNENHNSRIAILAAQEYPCGVGIERKLSTSTGQTETYLAIRLGKHLDSLGTVRMSIVE